MSNAKGVNYCGEVIWNPIKLKICVLYKCSPFPLEPNAIASLIIIKPNNFSFKTIVEII